MWGLLPLCVFMTARFSPRARITFRPTGCKVLRTNPPKVVDEHSSMIRGHRGEEILNGGDTEPVVVAEAPALGRRRAHREMRRD